MSKAEKQIIKGAQDALAMAQGKSSGRVHTLPVESTSMCSKSACI